MEVIARKICHALLKAIYFILLSGELYTSEKLGNDSTGDGTEAKPFKSVLQAMRSHGKQPFPLIYVDAKEEGKVPHFFLYWNYFILLYIRGTSIFCYIAN